MRLNDLHPGTGSRKGRKRVAVFYGAGHLSDMANRLEKDFGLRREKQKWLVA